MFDQQNLIIAHIAVEKGDLKKKKTDEPIHVNTILSIKLWLSVWRSLSCIITKSNGNYAKDVDSPTNLAMGRNFTPINSLDGVFR